MLNRRAFYFLFSTLITVGIFSFLFSKVTPGDILDILRNSNRNLVVSFLILSISMSIARTWRYWIILNVSGYKVGTIPLFLVTLVRNLFSDLLPARLGTLVYIYIINSRLGVPFAAAVSSFALSFLFDIFALFPIGLAIVSTFPVEHIGIPTLLILLTVLFFLAGAGIWYSPQLLFRIGSINRLSKSKFGKVFSLEARKIASELNQAKEKKIFIHILLLSIVVRVTKYASLTAFLYALLIPLGFKIQFVGIINSLIGIGAAELAASLPISGIAGFGLYEGTWSAVFSLLDFPSDIANLTSVAHHLFTQVYGYSIGGGALILLLLPYFSSRKKERTMNKVPSLKRFFGQLFAFSLLVIGLVILTGTSRAGAGEKAAGNPNSGNKTPESAPEWMDNLSGEIIFDSNISGTFGIHRINLMTLKSQPVFDSPQHEIYPDPSPDGKRIVLARTRSLSRFAKASIWTINYDGTDLKKLASKATFPTFSRNGLGIYFERDRKRIMFLDLSNGKEMALFPKPENPFGDFQVVKPRISPDGRYAAFTSDRGGRWNAWLADLETGKSEKIGSGCEPAWFKKGKIAWVAGSRMKGGSGLMEFDLREKQRDKVFYDPEHPFNHEYFPSIILNDAFLIYGACPETEHSHNDANYELFITDLKNNRIFQLTKNGRTNRWPKLRVKG